MILYQIVNRELVFVRQLRPDELASLGSDKDAWLKAHGYGSEFTLRRGIVREVTASESRKLAHDAASLKRRGLCPSAATAIIAKLGERAA
jgi:hypothetical protein